MWPGFDAIHDLFVGVEPLGSQPDLHLGEEIVIAWRQVRTVRRVVESLPVEELDQSIYASRSVGPRVVVQENDAFTEHPPPPSETYAAFHNKPLTLLWSLVPCILSTKFPCDPRKLCAIIFLFDSVCLNFLGLLGECVCIHSLDCSLISAFTNYTQVTSPVTILSRNSSPSSQ